MAKVNFVNEGVQTEVNACTNLRKIAKKNGVQIYQGLDKFFNCHGFGLCGTCVVEINDLSKVSPKRHSEDLLLTKKGKNGDSRRLACQCLIYGDVEITTLTRQY